MSPQQFRLIDQIFQTAVELPLGERDAYLAEACQEDVLLRAEVESLLRSDGEAEGLLDRTVIEAGERLRSGLHAPIIGRYVGPYQIVEEIGHGGMGTVYLGLRADDQYVRTVAIKFISRGMDTPEALSRFRVERQVLAALQHPNIAMLIDGGTADDGRPYIVMEYIKGEPLMEYCQNRELAIADRLALFASVCSAVHHAHQMLVIHRDIKPANVLVTAEGVPKLLDFGIAKFLAPELVPGGVNPTMTIMRRLTPQYASPEQIRGMALTTASDVYSLGVLLYELLTGVSPYPTIGESIAEIEKAVCEKEPLRLSRAVSQDSRLRRQLAGDLETIVAMAMRKEPSRRYNSAQQFADDIGRYLKGAPVIARDDTLLYVVNKLVRRNLVASTAFGLLGISVVAGWTATIHEARRSNARFQEVRQLANTLLTDLPRDIRNLPGSMPVRAKLVRTALTYLNSLSKDAAGDVNLQFELARAYELVGDVQGDPDGPNLGQYREAIASYRQSLVLAQRVAASKKDWQVVHMLAWLNLKIGDLQWRLGEGPDAFASYRETLRISAEGRKQFADPRADSLEREGYQRITRALTASRRLSEARDNGQLAIAAATRFSVKQPGPESSTQLAVANLVYGDVLGVSGQLLQSRQAYTSAVESLERIGQSDPQNYAVMEDLADAYRRLGDLLGAPTYFHFAEPVLAASYLEKALAIERRLSAHDPYSVQGRSRLALALRRLASVERDAKPQQAVVLYREAIEVSQELLTNSPSDLSYQRELAVHRTGFARALVRLNKSEEASDQLSEALQTQRTLIARFPQRAVIREDLFHTLTALGTLSLSLHESESALAHYREALQVAQELLNRDHTSLYAERCVADAMRGVGDAYATLPHSDKSFARDAYAEALATWSRWNRDGIAVPHSTRQEQELKTILAHLR